MARPLSELPAEVRVLNADRLPRQERAGRSESRRKSKRAGLFTGWWIDPETRARIRRARQADFAEAYRLRSKHADVLAGQMGYDLGPDEQQIVKAEARQRIRAARRKVSRRVSGPQEKRQAFIELDSTGAEAAVSALVGSEWQGVDRYAGDLANSDEVRQTRHRNGRLRIYPRDHSERRYWLVTGAFPRYLIVGWAYGWEGKQKPLAKLTAEGDDVHLLDQAELRPAIG